MIISNIMGGLGNQLFQYAAGRCLAILNKTHLKLDATGFNDYKLRNFDLHNLNIHAGFASEKEIKSLLPSHNFEKALQYLSPQNKRTYYREKHFHFDESFYKLGGNVYLKGYFQSEKYFMPVKEQIKKDFSFKGEMSSALISFAGKIYGETSVSVHIRRGDISKDTASANYHGNLPLDYYQQAIEIMRSKIPNPVFYFFSDDISWVKENIKISNAVYVSGELTKNHVEDLYLMSQCRHNIVANSSFSWWGAWLNNNPDKIVITPKNWFNKGPKDTYDLYPPGWLII